ncbi:hypothetical protein IFT48_03535 [Pseudomonas fluorescens]|uniref:hypothetical protein n=1 Tax=Pseudomonas fluorescens TaxID=294 RepID=UPI001930A475|nr:hypothetical protein [Pseudomonas fluorescens]MBD8089041.1 hypothetical protein [Pseudomonas fluorescens]
MKIIACLLALLAPLACQAENIIRIAAPISLGHASAPDEGNWVYEESHQASFPATVCALTPNQNTFGLGRFTQYYRCTETQTITTFFSERNTITDQYRPVRDPSVEVVSKVTSDSVSKTGECSFSLSNPATYWNKRLTTEYAGYADTIAWQGVLNRQYFTNSDSITLSGQLFLRGAYQKSDAVYDYYASCKAD